MPLPASLSKVTVTGTFYKNDGTFETGTISFTRPVYLKSSADNAFVLPGSISAVLNGSGFFSVDLPVTDAVGWEPSDWVYIVTETFSSGKRVYGIILPLAEGNKDMADVIPVFASEGFQFLPLDGGELRGSVSLLSSFAGGEDDGVVGHFDSTSRFNLASYQRAGVNFWGEIVRIKSQRADSKQNVAWYFPDGGYDVSRNAVGTQKPVVWVGAHWEANDHSTKEAHWSVSVPDTTGALKTRFEIPFVDQEASPTNPRQGVTISNIQTNLADFSIRADLGVSGQGVLRIGGSNTVNKDILLSNSSNRATSGRRWIIRSNNTTESGSNFGTDFQLLAHDDTGALIAPRLHVARSTGNVGFGTTTVTGAKVTATWGTSGVHGFLAQPSATPGTGAAYAHVSTLTTERSLQFQVTGDTNSRLVVLADGKHEWGDGAATRDVTLYRGAANSLRTDDDFIITDTALGFRAGGTVAPAAAFQAERSSAAASAFTSMVTSDAVRRWNVLADGMIEWGDGTLARDTTLYRSAANVLKTDDSFHVALTFRHLGTSLGFYNASAIAKPTVSGAKGGNAALGSLLTALVNLGLITDTTTA